ncbi:Proline-rich protein PRCC [Linum perenne]
MDSLVASYGSSDEDEPQQQRPDRRSSSSLPPARSPLFSALPRPNSSSSAASSPSSSLFSSSLPPPKSKTSNLSNPNPKRIIQIKPPPLPTYPDDDDDDEPVRPRKPEIPTATGSSSVKSFLSSIPAPRSSSALGALPSASSSGRRSILETSSDATASHPDPAAGIVYSQNAETGAAATFDSGYEEYSSYQSYDSGSSNGAGIDQTVSEGGYQAAASYGNNWGDEAAVATTVDASAGSFFRGKRGRPIEIIEVKQDELTKNRPREDQVKSTGIAFGPAYQPVSSAKGKPTKLHKRKHQIGTLYFDMKQKEMELQERRSKGFLTKAQTHAKYGW